MLKAIGYHQVTSLAAAQSLPSIPASENAQLVVILQAETQDVRWRDDGTDPTGTVGNLLVKNTLFTYEGKLSGFRFIETTASAKLNVNYYRNV